MKIQAPKRINTEDFQSEEKVLVEKIAFSVNTFMEEVFIAMSQKINISDNLNQNIINISKVNVDANGDLNSPKSFKVDLNSNVIGLLVIRTFGTEYVDGGTPLIDFSENSGIIKIKNIQGLVADTDYKLVILAYGD